MFCIVGWVPAGKGALVPKRAAHPNGHTLSPTKFFQKSQNYQSADIQSTTKIHHPKISTFRALVAEM